MATDDVELDLVGDEGRPLAFTLTGAGGGEAATERFEDVRW